ncbi:hypothetical protein quinque_002871 [Culex quinquefasciatus]
MDVEDIDPHLCTHLVYAFFGLHQNGSIAVLDPWLDLEDNWGRGNVRKFNELKEVNPKMKTLAAVGGYNEGSETFSMVSSDTDLRQRFAVSARDFCVRHGFDGIDIGWEYPGQRGGDPAADKSNFVLLLAHVKQIFAAAGLMLTAALAASQNQAEISYDIPGLSQHLDFINLMTYNYNGGWDVVTGHNAPLLAGPADVTDFQQMLNVHHSVMYWIRQGAPENKINLGIAFYGRTFTLSNVDKYGLRAAVKGPGIHGAYTQEDGYLAYYEISTQQEKIAQENEKNELADLELTAISAMEELEGKQTTLSQMQKLNETTPRRDKINEHYKRALRSYLDVTPTQETKETPKQSPPRSKRQLFPDAHEGPSGADIPEPEPAAQSSSGMKPARKRFRLCDIYERSFGEPPKCAHYAEGDVKALLKCAIAHGPNFVAYAEEHSVRFSDFSGKM